MVFLCGQTRLKGLRPDETFDDWTVIDTEIESYYKISVNSEQ